jgi:hypothetical protein
VENYFNYFTEIEEHFQRRRGTLTLLSPLDWALMEIWKEAGIPLEAVLRGIDTTFDRWEKRPKHTRKINGLAFCAQAVLVTAEEMAEAAVGKAAPKTADFALEKEAVCNYLVGNAEYLESGRLPESIRALAIETATGLRQAAASLEMRGPSEAEELERRLTVMEEKLLASLLASTPEAALLELRTEADRDLAPYRSRMSGPQIAQLHRQYVHKRLIEQYRLPRLSLFYMQ